jgi:hypothetical protein
VSGSTRARRGAAGVLAVASTLAGGCIVLPVPVRSARPAELRTHTRGSDKEQPEVRDGVTTRREILLLMGEPDRAWGEHGEQFFLYRAEDVHALILVLIFGPGTGGAAGVPLGSRLFLALEFDGRGVLRRHTLSNCMFHDTDGASDACYRFERGG